MDKLTAGLTADLIIRIAEMEIKEMVERGQIPAAFANNKDFMNGVVIGIALASEKLPVISEARQQASARKQSKN